MYRIEYSRDGSHTVYSEAGGSYFHNPNGAVEESLEVYFQRSGLLHALQDNSGELPLSVMEIGFGTGLNLLLLANAAEEFVVQRPLHFCSVEAFPLAVEQIEALNYPEFLKHADQLPGLSEIFRKLHAVTESGHEIPPVRGRFGRISYCVYACTFAAFTKQPLPPEWPAFTHIMHDPFDPQVSPELWTPAVFEALKQRSADDAVLTTYGASTAARASMAVGGWLPARAPGALGKREMTIAALQPDTPGFSHYKRLNETRLRQRYHAGDFAPKSERQ